MSHPDNLPQDLLEKGIVSETQTVCPVRLFKQAKGELMEGQDMKVEKTKTMLVGQENLDPATQGNGGDQNQEGAQKVRLSITKDLTRQCVF